MSLTLLHAISVGPSLFVCAGCALFFVLRYALTEDRRDWRMFLCAFVPLVGTMLCTWVANREGAWMTTRYDLFVYRFDLALGEPSFRLGGMLLTHFWGVWIVNFAYGLLSAAVMALLMGYAWRPEPELRTVVLALLLNFVVAPILYLIFPVSGPQFAFAGFPHRPAVIAPHVIHLASAPNGVPSVHFSTALLIWWYARRWTTGRFAALIYLFLTVLSTLASGQHYTFDLIWAFPYALAMAVLAQRFAPTRPGDSYVVAGAEMLS